MFNHVVTKLGSIAGDVAEGPDCLLCHHWVRRAKQSDESSHSSSTDDSLGLF